MEFLEVVGRRRSIRWFAPGRPVPEEAVQRILETARMTGSPGNTQPWRAVVVVAGDLEPAAREALLEANNHQRAQAQAPVWIYWFADPAATTPEAFLERVREQLPVGSIPASFGWTEQAVREAIVEGVPAERGLPALDSTIHGLPPEVSVVLAVQETNAACAVAALAAVNEGLGTCLHIVAAPAHQEPVKEMLGVPERLVAVWVQLVGHPAEQDDAGGQRPRLPFEALFSLGRWGTPFPRSPRVVGDLEREGLIQAPAPLPGREAELQRLAREFGYADPPPPP